MRGLSDSGNIAYGYGDEETQESSFSFQCKQSVLTANASQDSLHSLACYTSMVVSASVLQFCDMY